MPNVFHNTLEISGNLSEIISKSKGDFPKDFPYDCLFSKFFPPPENANEEWGKTKDGSKMNQNKSVIYFDSAWVAGTHLFIV